MTLSCCFKQPSPATSPPSRPTFPILVFQPAASSGGTRFQSGNYWDLGQRSLRTSSKCQLLLAGGDWRHQTGLAPAQSPCCWCWCGESWWWSKLVAKWLNATPRHPSCTAPGLPWMWHRQLPNGRTKHLKRSDLCQTICESEKLTRLNPSWHSEGGNQCSR